MTVTAAHPGYVWSCPICGQAAAGPPHPGHVLFCSIDGTQMERTPAPLVTNPPADPPA